MSDRILLPMTARDLRRTVGEEAVAIIEHHSQVLLTQQQVIGKLVLQVERLTKELSDQRTHVLKLADEQRAYVDREDRDTRIVLRGFVARPFLERLRWLLTGQ